MAVPNIVGAGMEPHPIMAAISGTRAGRHERWGQAVLALPMLLVQQLAAAVSAVALAGAAVAAALLLRRVGAGSGVAADSGSSTTSELVGQS